MIVAFLAFALVIVITIGTGVSVVHHMIYWDTNHLKLDITFFAISLLSFITMCHILIKNRAEIRGLLQKDEEA